jgi:glycolate oxidase FAD binding subunit
VHATLRPATERELSSLLADHAAKRTPMEVAGAGSKRSVGRPVQAAATLTTTGLRGITLYEPTELVMAAQAGTSLAEVESELGAHRQMLAFEPLDVGPMFGTATFQGTIGAAFATNLSGARRITSGAARDHMLGVRAVNGRGEVFKSGGRVMKNVTGYDLARGLAGSWGTLAVLSEVTFKVMPMPERTATLALWGLTDELAVEAMCAAMGAPYEVSGTVHLQGPMAGRLQDERLRSPGKALTALRIENFSKSVAYRTGKLQEVLAPYGEVHVLDHADSLWLWDELRALSVLQRGSKPLWRISTAPRAGPAVVAAIAQHMSVEAFYDWSGGLIWLEVPDSADAGATDIRRVIARQGGHATLIRAGASVRAAVEVFQPLDPAVERLTRQLKSTFDPAGILNPGRMYSTM